MKHIEFITDCIKKYEVGEPIFVADLIEAFIKDYPWKDIIPDRAKAAACVSMNLQRIKKENLIPELRFYKKGIWYKTKNTPFGEAEIKTQIIVKRKYMENGNGYITGYEALNRYGFSTQIPKDVIIATNKAKYFQQKDEELGVTIKPPKTRITQGNKYYLVVLDMLEIIDKAIITDPEPYKRFNKIINNHGLKYEILIGFAKKYYPKRVIYEIGKLAENIMEII